MGQSYTAEADYSSVDKSAGMLLPGKKTSKSQRVNKQEVLRSANSGKWLIDDAEAIQSQMMHEDNHDCASSSFMLDESFQQLSIREAK
jgi:hypothetical protein